jgi:hypothetical protein
MSSKGARPQKLGMLAVLVQIGGGGYLSPTAKSIALSDFVSAANADQGIQEYGEWWP